MVCKSRFQYPQVSMLPDGMLPDGIGLIMPEVYALPWATRLHPKYGCCALMDRVICAVKAMGIRLKQGGPVHLLHAQTHSCLRFLEVIKDTNRPRSRPTFHYRSCNRQLHFKGS